MARGADRGKAARSGSAQPLLPVALGGALGASARHLLGLATIGLWPAAGLPLGTIAANGLGSLLIGLVAALMLRDAPSVATPARRQFLIAGFCGGFTTFSIFSFELLHFIETGAFVLAGGYLLLSLIVWLGAVALGMRLGRRIRSRP
ncbi:CrcB family protein [Saliniramus sp.]|uniref:fluoride efflux transporter FluC n=1 Tax=Saliniramus sp. TaxID=2986772 RepID=UPI002B599DDF|nr:CrcB family protein [Saliniramus sp.]HMB09487.1 CrcB family protein [Saliniramus sp.]